MNILGRQNAAFTTQKYCTVRGLNKAKPRTIKVWSEFIEKLLYLNRAPEYI